MLARCRSQFVRHLPTRHLRLVLALVPAVVARVHCPVRHPRRFRPGVVPNHRPVVRRQERPNCHWVSEQFAPMNCRNHLAFPRRRQLPARVLAQVLEAPVPQHWRLNWELERQSDPRPVPVAEELPSCLGPHLVRPLVGLVAIRLRFRPRHCRRERRSERARDYFQRRRQPAQESPGPEVDSSRRHWRHPNRGRLKEHPRPD